MHDLHEANKIIKKILEFGLDNGLKKIAKVKIDFGAIVEHGSEILPENIAYNIKLLAKNTIADGLEVEIYKIKAEHWILKEIEGE